MPPHDLNTLTLISVLRSGPFENTHSMSSWYDVMAAEDERQTMRVVRMSPGDWNNEATRMLRTARPGQIVNVLAAIMALDAQRVSAGQAVAPAPLSQDDLDWRVWCDMVEAPEKYGADIVEWLELDARVSATRAQAYWLQREQDRADEEANAQVPWRDLYLQVAKAAAEKGEREWFRRDIKRLVLRRRKALMCIQSVVRGHLVRNRVEHMDCCMCLSHRVCPLKTDVGMMCRDCAEQGPHEDITGPVADPWNWFRADYTDLALATDQSEEPTGPVCTICACGPATDQFGAFYCEGCLDEKQSCRECGDMFIKGTGPGMGFCDRECARAGW